jgi:hypothetical protein
VWGANQRYACVFFELCKTCGGLPECASDAVSGSRRAVHRMSGRETDRGRGTIATAIAKADGFQTNCSTFEVFLLFFLYVFFIAVMHVIYVRICIFVMRVGCRRQAVGVGKTKMEERERGVLPVRRVPEQAMERGMQESADQEKILLEVILFFHFLYVLYVGVFFECVFPL